MSTRALLRVVSVALALSIGPAASAQEAGGFSAGPGLAPATATPDTTTPAAPGAPPPAAPSTTTSAAPSTTTAPPAGATPPNTAAPPAPSTAPAAPSDAPAPTRSTGYETVVQSSPTWTQDRTFPGTRFWKLDPGSYELEVWWRVRKPRDEDAFHILQAEVEIGLTPRLQLDIYENWTTENSGTMHHDGNQIEARIAFDPVYGRTPLNPVLYLEWQPRHLQADRAEARLLLGGALLGPRLVGAVNLFYEQNVTKETDGWVPNPELGVTAASSLAVLGQFLRAGGEVKLAFEKDHWGDARWQKQLLVGPNVSARIVSQAMKLYATVLFGVTHDAKSVDAFLIAAYAL
jgi:hypothetical protein